MDNLIKYISNTLINGAKNFDIENEKFLSKLVNDTIETSIIKPKNEGLKFAIDKYVNIGDSVALVYADKGDIETSILYYIIRDFTLADVVLKDGTRVALLYNSKFDETFELENVEILENAIEETEYEKRLAILDGNSLISPLLKDDKVESLKDLDFKLVNFNVSGNVAPGREKLLIKIDNKLVSFLDYNFKVSSEGYILVENGEIYSFKFMFITGTIEGSNIKITEDNPFVLGVTVKDYETLKNITLIDIDKTGEKNG